MKRRMLIALSHDTVLRAEGHRERLLGLLGLLVDFDLAWLIPETLRERDPLSDAPVFTFDEPSVGSLKVPYLVDWSPSFRTASKRAIASFEPDIVLCDLPWGAHWIAASSGLPVVYLSHGVERDFTDTTLLHLGVCFFPFTVVGRAIVGWLERRACRSVALTVAMSDTDVARYQQLFGVTNAVGVAQPMAMRPLHSKRAESRARWGLRDDELVCLFHGSWHHVPNRVAGELIRSSIASAFLDRRVRFLLAGTGMEPFTERNVTGVGFVEDLDSFLAAGDLAVLPILHGAGVRMKTFDYVRASLPIVATAKAIEGVRFVDGVHAAVAANDCGAFTARLAELINAPESWPALCANAQAFAAAAHDPHRISAVLGEALDRCLSTKTAVREGAQLTGG